MPFSNCTIIYDLHNTTLFGLIIFYIYVALTAIVAVFGNLLVSAAILWRFGGKDEKPRKDSKLPKTRNILILNLSVIDILMGIILTIWIFNQDIYTSMITFSLCFTSTSNHLAIALDRFYRIFYYCGITDANRERRILYSVSIALWIIPLVMFITVLAVNREIYTVVTYTLSPTVSFLVVNIIAVLYFLIFVKVRKHEERMAEKLGRKKFKKTKLVLKAYTILVVADAICWLPWIVESLRIYFTGYVGLPEEERCLDVTPAYYYTFSLGLVNAAANAIIYWKTLPDINKGVARIIKCMTSYCRSVAKDTPNEEISVSRNTTTKSEQRGLDYIINE